MKLNEAISIGILLCEEDPTPENCINYVIDNVTMLFDFTKLEETFQELTELFVESCRTFGNYFYDCGHFGRTDVNVRFCLKCRVSKDYLKRKYGGKNAEK